MGTIRRRLWLSGLTGRVRVNALFDTGSTHTLIREDIAGRVGPLHELDEPATLHAIRDSFRVRKAVFAHIKIGRHKVAVVPPAVDGLSEEIIIGTDIMQRYDIRLQPRRDRIVVDPEMLIHRV